MVVELFCELKWHDHSRETYHFCFITNLEGRYLPECTGFCFAGRIFDKMSQSHLNYICFVVLQLQYSGDTIRRKKWVLLVPT